MEVKPYDIKINGKGYLLKAGSYSSGKLTPNVEKVATGEVNYNDLSDQESWPQSDWRGGFYQKFDLDRSKFLNSTGIEIMDTTGSFRLAKRFAQTAATQTSVFGGYVNLSGVYFSHTGQVLNFTTNFQTYASAVNLSATLNDKNMIVFNDKLYVGTGAKVLWASSNPTSNTGWTAEQSGTYSIGSMDTMGSYLYASDTGKNLLAYDGVLLSQVLSDKRWKILKVKSFNGRLYLGCIDEDRLGVACLRVFDGSVAYTVQTWSGIARSDLAFSIFDVFNGKLYFNINPDYYEVDIYAYNGDSVELEMYVNARDPNSVAGPFTEDTSLQFTTADDLIVADGKLFLSVTVAGAEGFSSGYTEVYCNPGTYWYRYKKVDDAARNPVAGFKSRLFAYRDDTNNILGLIRGPDSADKEDTYRIDFNSTAVESSGLLQSSVIDMDLFSVSKMVNSMETYHQTMPVSAMVTNYLLGLESTITTASFTNSTVNSVLTTMKLSNNNTARKFQYQVYLSAGGLSPIVDDVVLRYIIQPDYKQVWSFQVLVQDNLELKDGSKERRSGMEIMRDLKTATKAGVVQFLDVDGTLYDQKNPDPTQRGVIVKDVQRLGPYPFGHEGPEFVMSIVLTEA